MVLTPSLADLDMIYGRTNEKPCWATLSLQSTRLQKDTETQEYFSKMIGEKHTLLAHRYQSEAWPIIKPADLAHLEHDLIVFAMTGPCGCIKNL